MLVRSRGQQKPSSNGAVVSSKKGECCTKGVLMEVDVELCVCFGVQAAWRSANNARRTRRERGWGVEPMKNAYCLLTTQYWSSHAQRQADGQAGTGSRQRGCVCAMGAGSAPQSDESRRVFCVVLHPVQRVGKGPPKGRHALGRCCPAVAPCNLQGCFPA